MFKDKILQYGEPGQDKHYPYRWVEKKDILNLARIVVFLKQHPEYMYFDNGYEERVTIKYYIESIKELIGRCIRHINRLSQGLDHLNGTEDIEIASIRSREWYTQSWRHPGVCYADLTRKMSRFELVKEYHIKLKAAIATGNEDYIKLVKEKSVGIPDLTTYKRNCVKVRLARQIKAERAKLEILE